MHFPRVLLVEADSVFVGMWSQWRLRKFGSNAAPAAFGCYKPQMKVLVAAWDTDRVGVGWIDARGTVPALSTKTAHKTKLHLISFTEFRNVNVDHLTQQSAPLNVHRKRFYM